MKNNTRDSVAFDFEIGNVTCSPCRDCIRRGRFPSCMADCDALDRFQRVLARTVSCSRPNDTGGYAVARPDRYRPEA